MLTLRKGDATKFLSPQSSLIERLKSDGWSIDGEHAPVDAEIEALRAQAEALGLKVHHKAGSDKIREMISEATKDA